MEQQKVTFKIPDSGPADPFILTTTLRIRNPDSPSWSGDKLSIVIEPKPVLLKAVHQDFSGLIGGSGFGSPAGSEAGTPAKSTEIVHLYGTNFGPVTPPIPDGGAAPLAPLSQTVNPVTCNVSNLSLAPLYPAAVLFAGLAPGMTGIYQIDVKLPGFYPGNGSISLACTVYDQQTRVLLTIVP